MVGPPVPAVRAHPIVVLVAIVVVVVFATAKPLRIVCQHVDIAVNFFCIISTVSTIVVVIIVPSPEP